MDELDLGQTIRGFAAGQKLFGRYALVRILGRGGMGVVWLARDEKLDRDVALKFVPELIVHDAAVLDELKRETKRSLELTHHNIVRIHDFADDGQSACISMEYVDGPTLSALRVERPNKLFDVSELAPWIEQTCAALDYAHNTARIVHRDLKPTNLMLNSKGVLKIADFGIALSLTESVSMMTMARGTSGTLVYMSPQQLGGLKASPSDDIYSLGASIYELLTGKPPFYCGNIDAQIKDRIAPSMTERRAELEIENTQSIPTEWEQTVAACLAKDPGRRPQSVAEIATGLALNIPRTVTKPWASVNSNRKWLRPKPLIAASLALIIAVTAAAGWYFGIYLPKESARKAEELRQELGSDQQQENARAARKRPATRKRK